MKRRRKPFKVRPSVEFPATVKEAIYERAGGMCQRCGVAPITEYHHRRMRSQGGRGTLDNCAGLCLSCHRDVHSNPDESYKRGWLIRSWDYGEAS